MGDIKVEWVYGNLHLIGAVKPGMPNRLNTWYPTRKEFKPKTCRLFTLRRSLIQYKIGTIKDDKLKEVIGTLVRIFSQ